MLGKFWQVALATMGSVPDNEGNAQESPTQVADAVRLVSDAIVRVEDTAEVANRTVFDGSIGAYHGTFRRQTPKSQQGETGMKSHIVRLLLVVGITTAMAGNALAQAKMMEDQAKWELHNHYYGGGGYGMGGGSYGWGRPGAAMGYGQANIDNAEAREINGQARAEHLQNHNYAVSSYYANKEKHDAFVDAHRDPRLTTEQEAQIKSELEPGRLSTAQFDRSINVIHWPAILRESEFSKTRQALDHLFHERTPSNSGEASENYIQIKQNCDEMLHTLGDKLRNDDLPNVTFVVCEHFIKSLAYEGTFTVKQ